MSSISQFKNNGQNLSLAAGSAAIAANDLVEIGGPGLEAWTVGTIDYAANASAGSLRAQQSVVAAAMPSASRQPIARDRLGYIYVIGTNSSGNLVVYKYTALGAVVSSFILDATATVIATAQVFQIQNGNYACVYARASGALFYVVFDSALSLIAGPISVATERAATNVVYHASCALSGGGFALVYQVSGAVGINLATYSNAGVQVLAPTNIQTLAGSAAQEFLKLGQLSNGNLVCAFRGTMTAGGVAGTSFVIVNVSGGNVAGPTNVDATSTLGFVELSIIQGVGFAIADANASNLVCGVYTNGGTVQGTPFSVGNTNNSVAFPQIKLMNDGVGYWLAYFSSAGNGVYVVPISAVGVIGVAASGLGASTLSANTYGMDAEIVNGLIVVLAASSLALGQYWMTIGLPDASLGVSSPYLRVTPTVFGTAAATTGSKGPRVISGGAGLYLGANPPASTPTNPGTCGDFTAIFLYDQQNTATTFFGIQKVEATAIIGAAWNAVPAGAPGSPVSVNPGQGEYVTSFVGGSAGTLFNHLGNIPAGTSGVLYGHGAALSGIAQGVSGAVQQTSVIPPGAMMGYGGGVVPDGWLLCYGQLLSRSDFGPLFAAIQTTWGAGDGVTTFNAPDGRGRVMAGADNMGGVAAGNLGTGATFGFTGAATLGVVGGQQSHTMTLAELVSHTHSTVVASGTNAGSTGGPVNGVTTGTTGASGSGNAFNVVQPTLIVNVIVKT